MSEWLNPYDLDERHEQRKLHLGRYNWAALQVRGQKIANAACSCNYGSDILMKAALAVNREVVGFDRNPAGLEMAKRDYPHLEVREGDIQNESFEGFEALVCLETFEHLQDPWAFLDQLAPSVKELVLSTPIIPTKHFNEWHLHDFTMQEVRDGLDVRGWKIEGEAYQDEEMLPKPTYGLFYAIRK